MKNLNVYEGITHEINVCIDINYDNSTLSRACVFTLLGHVEKKNVYFLLFIITHDFSNGKKLLINK